MSSVFRAGATALITGGASGVGFALAQLCQSHEMHLVLVDINSDYLTKAKDILGAPPANEKIETYQMDVTQISDWQKLRSEVEAKFATIDLLILNAGASFKPEEGKQSWDDVEYFQKTYATNVFGPLNGLSTFLPMIRKNDPCNSSSIIITGSKQGITNPPSNPAYNSSKAALKSLTEHLAHDLRSSSPPLHNSNISVHLLIPGWTYTSLSGNKGPMSDDQALKSKPKGAWLPSQVAEYAYRKMVEEKKFYIVCPDEDVSEELDQARMKWGAEDVVEGRPALSRWEEGWKDRSGRWIKEEAESRRKKS